MVQLMASVLGLLGFICNYVFYVFGVIFRFVFRSQGSDCKKEYDCSLIRFQQDNNTGSRDLNTEGFREEEESGFSLEESESGNKSNGESENSMSALAATSANKYEFVFGNGISGFLEEPKSLSFSVQELYLGSNDHSVCNNQMLNSEEEVVDLEKTEDCVESFGVRMDLEKAEQKTITENGVSEKEEIVVGLEKTEDSVESFGVGMVLEKAEHRTISENGVSEKEEIVVGLEKTEDSVESFGVGMVLEKAEHRTIIENGVSEKAEIVVGSEINSLAKNDSVDEVESVSEDCSLRFGSEPETMNSSGELSMNNHIIDSFTYEFLAYRNVDLGLESEGLLGNDSEKIVEDIEEISSWDTSLSGPEEIAARDESIDSDSDEEYIELEPHFKNLSSLEDKTLFVRESVEFENKHKEEDLVQDETEPGYNLEKSEETNMGEKPFDSNSDYQDDFDFTWEHGDVIEQLKMELRNARTGGLPTILEEEEPESPNMIEGLKPLKIDVKFEFKDRMEEIQKVYKSYAERMRKLDMLNSQAMHAIGFLQLKDPVKSTSMQNPSASATKSLSHNIWSRKPRRVTADPMQNYIGELQSNLELVYVGQVCLSWEILHWQYGKVQELQEYNSHGFHQYNQVAGEFQLFQVLMQRFKENEAFQGPRVQNYVNHRCVLRNLLQVPIIRDDCMKDKKLRREEEEDAISSGMLVKIIEDSLRVFWEFLCTDKDEKNVILNTPQQNYINLQNAADLQLLMNTRADLQKKDKRLRDILRSGNCIVKRFQKPHNDQLDHLLIFAQVELKLVSRVLNMSRLTRDQLVWCHEKLDQLNFVNRKIHMEPSFFLFPC